MQTKRKASQSLFDQQPTKPTGSRYAITKRREIAVAAGETVVVTPRLPGLYKGMIWFSFGLNAVLLLALLIGGLMALNAWRDYKNIVAQLTPQVNTQGVVGQTVRDMATTAQTGADGRAQVADDALQLTRQKLGDVTGAVEGLQNATIRASIPIDQQLPINLQVPVDQDTDVVLTAPVPLPPVNADITFPGGGGQLHTSVRLTLPQGLRLPVHLNTNIPLQQQIPIKFDVPVTIPLRNTELAGPFQKLHDLLQPLVDFLTPASQATPAR